MVRSCICGRSQSNDGSWHITEMMMAIVMPLLVLSGCRDRADPNVPAVTRTPGSLTDLHSCTKLEIRYAPAMVGQLSPIRNRGLFSPAEFDSVSLSNPIVIEDPERIRAFVEFVATGTPIASRTLPTGPYAHIDCYRRDKTLITSLNLTQYWIIAAGKDWFEYPGPSYLGWRGPLMRPILSLTPQLHAFELRRACATNLARVGNEIVSYTDREKTDLPSAQWCDVMVQYWQRVFSDNSFSSLLQCPSAKEGECHFAINAACRLDSPGDTVLLFETKAGWNQHGGPELFTFDNHDPRGGLVLLNDRRVQFVRTAEELKQLRWK